MWEMEQVRKVPFQFGKRLVSVNIGVSGAVGWHYCHIKGHSAKLVRLTFYERGMT